MCLFIYVFIYVCIDLFIYQHLPRQLTYYPDIYHHSFQLWFLEIPRSQVERPSKLPRLDDVPGWGDMAFQNWGYIGYRKMELSIGNWWWNMINHDCGGVVIFLTHPRFKVPCAFMCFGPLGTSKWSFMCSISSLNSLRLVTNWRSRRQWRRWMPTRGSEVQSWEMVWSGFKHQ